MIDTKIERILHISHQLTYQFFDINDRISQAWLSLEAARGNAISLQLLNDELNNEISSAEELREPK